jgi:phage terminase Nu1 subunit (DNA packaging protein)
MAESVSKAEFARAIGKSRAYVHKLISRGLPTSRDGAKIPMPAGERWYKANVVRREDRPAEENEGVDTTDILDDDTTRAEADRRLTIAKAKLAELDFEKARGALVEADSVAEVWAMMISAAKARALLIPSSLATRLARESDSVVCEAMLKQAVDEMLMELSHHGEVTPC